jgi:hypothetical protein
MHRDSPYRDTGFYLILGIASAMLIGTAAVTIAGCRRDPPQPIGPTSTLVCSDASGNTTFAAESSGFWSYDDGMIYPVDAVAGEREVRYRPSTAERCRIVNR